ncbi:MAG TPA: DUF177 domain-containing protein [Anaerolineae bacterium]|nr:DUF177 domain-containing protein [Anaerolineae bacterium]
MGVTDYSGLRINVAQLLQSSTGAARRLELSDDIAGIDAELSVQSPLTGTVSLIRTADGILVTASLATTVQLECCRCLEPFSIPIRLEIEEEFHPTVDIQTGAVLPVSDTEEDATTIDEHHVLDLTEVVRQALFLAMPMNPLCKGDCAGLCPLCGNDLNQEQCRCVPDAVDPRLEVLRQLLTTQ